jgi:hypothetical protein
MNRLLLPLFVCLLLACALPSAGPPATTAPPARPKDGKPPDKDDPARDQFVRFVQQNAEDPARLEIILWGERKGDTREVRFRCARIGSTRKGAPVMLESATIYYKGDKIDRVYLPETFQFWNN